MKRSTLSGIFVLLFAWVATAQEVRFSAGFNSVNPGNAAPDVRFDGGAGLQFGADAQFGRDRIYLQPGIGFVYRNLEYTTVAPETADLFSSNFSTNALRFSVLGGYRFIDEVDRRAFNIRGFFGPTALFTLGSQFEETPNMILPTASGAEMFFTFGAGLDYDIFFVDASYDLALSNTFTDNWAAGRMNLFRVDIGVRLRLLGTRTSTPTTPGTGPTFSP